MLDSGAKTALVIGASGGIGKALVMQLQQQYPQVLAVSRSVLDVPLSNAVAQTLDTCDETVIKEYVQALFKQGVVLSAVFCCIGQLHDASVDIYPEKRLEDVSAAALNHYFTVNASVPMMWLKHLLPVLKGKHRCHVVFYSARVGSIQDNRLGGWYGYRASKAALNMLVKSAQVEYTRRAPNVVLVCYHPGTVDTPLSKPFQANVPAVKLLSAEHSCRALLGFLPDLTPEQAPHYLDWQGKSIPW